MKNVTYELIYEELKETMSHYDKEELITVLTLIRYMLKNGEEEKISTMELEFLISVIYQIETKQVRPIEAEAIETIIRDVETLESIKILDRREKDLFQIANTYFQFEKTNTYNKEKLEFLLDFYHPYNSVLQERYGFTIEDFVYFIQSVIAIYNDRINQLLALWGDKLTVKEFINHLFCFSLKILDFNCESFLWTRQEKIAGERILRRFSHPITKILTLEKEYPLNELPYIEHPIIDIGESYLFPSPDTLIANFQYLVEKDIFHKDLHKEYAKYKGKYLETEIANLIRKKIPNSKVYESARYHFEQKDNETDVLVIYDTNIIIIEAKGRALKEVSKRGNEKTMRQDLQDNLYHAFEQCDRTQRYIQSKDTVHFIVDGKTIPIENTRWIYNIQIKYYIRRFQHFSNSI